MYVCIYLKIDVYIYMMYAYVNKNCGNMSTFTHTYIYISLYILSSSIESSSSLMRADEFNGIDITVLVWT